jgi:hypothetical protein
LWSLDTSAFVAPEASTQLTPDAPTQLLAP